MHCFLISTLAEYQTRFWVEVGHNLQRHGYACAFISFDDRSTEMLRAQGFTVYALRNLPADPRETSRAACTELLSNYGIDAPERWFLHERVAFGEQNADTLMQKLCDSIRLGERAIAACKAAHGEVSLIQEVGGFLSVIGCFFAAQKARVPNWFIEPAFFKGRLFFTKDSFGAPPIVSQPMQTTRSDVQAYLDSALQTQRVVIPEKDRHHYSSALKKILSRHNLVRLVQKSIDKYVLGKKQEFGYLGRQIGMHLRMLINSALLRGSYTPLSALGRFVYFPLHVPGDMALTLRSPEYVDQLALLEHILRATPLTHQVAVKEHPAMIGALDAKRFLQLLKRYPQFKVIAPSTNNYDVLAATDLVVSINSKSGAEALLLGKRVAVLGEAFYSNCPLVHRLDSPRQLSDVIARLLASTPTATQKDVIDYFHAVWDSSFDGELYIADTARATQFNDALIAAVSDSARKNHLPPYPHLATGS